MVVLLVVVMGHAGGGSSSSSTPPHGSLCSARHWHCTNLSRARVPPLPCLQSCEAYERETLQDTKLSEATINKDSKRCPNPTCGIPIQKSSGCNHMKCPKCKVRGGHAASASASGERARAGHRALPLPCGINCRVTHPMPIPSLHHH